MRLEASHDAGGAQGGSTQAAGEARVGSCTDRWETGDTVAVAAQSGRVVVLVHL